MRFNGNASRRLRRLGLGMTLAAALAVTLAACSSSGTADTVATTQPSSAPAATTTAASSPPAAPATAAATDLAGSWSGKYSGAFTGTFTLTWQQTGSNLSGSIKLSNPSQTLPLNGKLSGTTISFGTVGSTEITYSGTVSGSTMSGHYQVHTPNGATGGPWSASKSS